MSTLFLKGASIFLVLFVGTSILMDQYNTEFGTVDFFERHGVLFLVFITFFPRLTLLFSSVPFGGFLWWLGLIVCPRILVAVLATVAYFHTNPLLVTVSWLVAIGGETLEKLGLSSKKRFMIKTFDANPRPYVRPDSDPPISIKSKDDAIEAEFTKE